MGSGSEKNSYGSTTLVFTTHVLKVTPIRVRFSPGFPPGAGFPGEQSHEELTTWVKPGFSRLQRGARSTLEHIFLREIMLLEEIPGKSAHGLTPLLKSAL
jgi:hypothetical protein